jgi:hypothetical protein
MKIDTFTSLQGQKTFDNGQARITDANPGESRKVVERIASTVYHKNEPVLPKTYGNFRIQQVYEIEDPEAMNARYNKVTNLFSNGIAERSVDLEVSYLSGLNELPASLQEKDWGFSVKNGKLEVIEGRDELTNTERSQINTILKESGVESAAESVADAVIEMIETERGPRGLSRGIGQYDVNSSNFVDIVDLRRYVEEHLPEGKFGKGRVNPNDVEGRYYLSGIGIMDQVSAKADKTFTGSQYR